MARREFLEYVWNTCIVPQLGYSFSRNHTLPYSIIGLQEMNLAYFYPDIYWNTACLTTNASANENIEGNKSTDYGKIAKAIGDMKMRGVKIALPDINTAKFGFAPDEAHNQIIFGLKGINGIGDDIVYEIIKHRPYESLEDFVSKNTIETRAMINLIKAGCFDGICRQSRQKTMRDYIVLLTKSKVEPKKALKMQNFPSLLELGILPKYDFQRRLFYFKRHVFQKGNSVTSGGTPKKDACALDEAAGIFFENECMGFFKEGIDYWESEGTLCITKNKFDKWYSMQMEGVKQWLSEKSTLEQYNKEQYKRFADAVWKKYCTGNISKWEMDSLSFYYTEHELEKVNKSKYGLTGYQDIPEEPVVIGKIQKKNKAGAVIREWDKYRLYKIAGTVLDRDANKHYITLLTTEGVVTVKFYDGAFVHYDKQISKKIDGSDKKTVLEKSWFSRGNKLLITGVRRGNTFYPKRYSDSIAQHTLCFIEEVYENGDLQLKYGREKVDT